ncbi:MAG TPA: aldehyde dehydrogenase family protein [Baekduia sp.]|uniref:aldehyde dehydrogenase family protein n=1 Tax=Baekduia sp. TaxID=2600305 RepID=UPI002B8B5574|nr:aldehyde dehydrogenase family protein [Baekduia sp.]HMJ32580.1 aldehyde dehydrogenase family protein [Baekduia sp.]
MRLDVDKTYKLYIGGSFVRSESGRRDPVADHAGDHVANVPRASRKDVRDAVRIARKALPGWRQRTAYNRAQILYRLAEAIESRRDGFVAQAVRDRRISTRQARAELALAVDTVVYYAGWCDKLAGVLGGINPVAAPYLSFSVPEPTGVVAVVAPPEPGLLGLLTELVPVLAAGNVAVVGLSERWPLTGLDLAEAIGVSDVPAGVVGLLSGRTAEIAPALAAHRDVDALVDAGQDEALGGELGRLASASVTRVSRPPLGDYREDAYRLGLGRLEAVIEMKTAWHPVGA